MSDLDTTGTNDAWDIAEFVSLGTATLYEASGEECYLPCSLRPVWPGAKVAGRALPVRTAAADNLPLHLALVAAHPGDVLVSASQGAPCGYWGEVLTVAAQQRGVAGLVIDGGVRDTERLADLRFPAFSSSIAVRTTAKNDPGTVGETVVIGGVSVHAGDLVVADADGIVVISAARVSEVLAAARQRQQKEAAYLDRIRHGALTVDLYSLGTSARGTDVPH
jgi:4-hydroxy-4-methyl-2-oxoglutarate aldolase